MPRPSTAELFSEYATFVWRVLRHQGIPDADLDDLVQEVFLVVHRRLQEVELTNVRAWIAGIAYRVAADGRRRAGRRHLQGGSATLESAERVEGDGPAEARLDATRELRLLDRALDRLDDEKRAVFVLAAIEELPLADVARIVECSLATAYYRLHRARSALRSALEELKKGDR
jgi:RNA polymerase sigma-70 factor (ECF subfamily)